MRKKFVKKVGSCVLSLAMTFSLGFPAFAAENSDLMAGKNGAVSQPELSIATKDSSGSDTVLVKSQGVTSLVSAVENGSKRTVTIHNIETGKEDFLIYDKQSSTIYSSITGKTVYLNNSEVSFRSVSSYSTLYFSYAQIREAIGDASNVAGLIAMIVAERPEVKIGAAIVSKLTTILSNLNMAVPSSSNHGLKLRIKTQKFYRTRMGRRQVYKVTHTVTSVSRY